MSGRWSAASDFDYFDEPWKAPTVTATCRVCGEPTPIDRETPPYVVCPVCIEKAEHTARRFEAERRRDDSLMFLAADLACDYIRR